MITSEAFPNALLSPKRAAQLILGFQSTELLALMLLFEEFSQLAFVPERGGFDHMEAMG